MATERQIRANRANAAKSTGPVTAAGKRISSQNAARRPLIAGTVVLKGESKRRFNDLAAALALQFKPRSFAETALVQTMVAARWRLLRIWGIQTAAFELEMARARQKAKPAEAASGAVLAAMAFRTMADTSNALALQLRFEAAYDRQFNQALGMLLKLRAAPNVEIPCQPPLTLLAETWDEDLQHEGIKHSELEPNSEPAPQPDPAIETTRCHHHPLRRPFSSEPDSGDHAAATAPIPAGSRRTGCCGRTSDRLRNRAATEGSGPQYPVRGRSRPRAQIRGVFGGQPVKGPFAAQTQAPFPPAITGNHCLPTPAAVPFLSGGVKVDVATESRGPQFGLTD
ncbi:MAG TPA: hypothetical protein VGG72_13310 [Bryobacteraceae bacterium]|jgi:hypothetical protein